MITTYSEISKLIGLDQVEVNIPGQEEADMLIDQARQGDRHAFTVLFRVVRFAKPQTSEEMAIVNRIFSSFNQIRSKFEQDIKDEKR